MAQTDDSSVDPVPLGELDTLAAQDLEPAEHMDDRLLRRDLKARMFGAQGSVSIGRYEVQRKIGRGGMGTVYVARDPELDREVALKLLRPDRRTGQARMLREARALARLTHPNVVTVHEVGTHDDRVYVAMELVRGQTLRQWLSASPPREEIYGVFAQAARGLQAAHDAGLVHRDFKPDNVLIGDDGRVRVVDFGVVKPAEPSEGEQEAEDMPAPFDSVDGDEVPPELTRTGQLLGTPAYMAAEQFLGGGIDTRTDVFALCVSLFEALAGTRPYAGHDAISVCRAVLTGEHETLRVEGVPSQLASLVERGLSRDKDRRPASLRELIEALDAAGSPPRSSRTRWWMVATMGAASAAGLGVLLLGGSPASEPPSPAPVAAAAATATAEPNDPALDEAFAAIAAAPDEEARVQAAHRFLATHGRAASEARRAIAHATIGDARWEASCARDFHGLCVEERPYEQAQIDAACRAPIRNRFVPLPRDPALVDEAREHLEAAVALAGVDVPEDPAEAEMFLEAIGRSRVQLADEEIEDLLALEPPTGLDFDYEEKEKLSRQAFELYFQQATERADDLTLAYAKVKGTDPEWTLVAGARTGMLSEALAEPLVAIPVPLVAPFDEQENRDAYCDALAQRTVAPLQTAKDTYAWCQRKAESFGLQALPIAGFCRDREAAVGSVLPAADEATP